MPRINRTMLMRALMLLAMWAAFAPIGAARAEFGAVAVGSTAGCDGHGYQAWVAHGMPSQRAADQGALAGCAGEGGVDCRVLMRFGKRQCGYVTVTNNGCDAPSTVAWGRSVAATLQACVAKRNPNSGACNRPAGGCNR